MNTDSGNADTSIGNVQLGREELIEKIKGLSYSIPLATIRLWQMNSNDGQPEGDFVAYPSDFPTPHDEYRKWPIEGLRPLREQAAPYILKAGFFPDDVDGGFTRWLWPMVQKLWDIRKVDGLAVDPYGLWMKALDPNVIPSRDIVASNPRLADTEEILRVSERARWLSTNSIELKRLLDESESQVCNSLNALHELRAVPPKRAKRQKVQIRLSHLEEEVNRHTHAYRRLYCDWMKVEHWHKVVELYERALIPYIASQRPPLLQGPHRVDYETLSAHLTRAAIEFENWANAKATSKVIPADPSTAFLNLSTMLGELLSWAVHPDPHALSRPPRNLVLVLRRRFGAARRGEFGRCIARGLW